jgi:adenylate kinase family enzyme
MRRIAVIGCPGAGKSTFALRLSARLGIAVVHLDRLHYFPPGTPPPPVQEWVRREQEVLQGEAWIADGNYPPTQHVRLEAADTVILLDFPRALCLRRALGRMLTGRWTKDPPDLPPGRRRRLDVALLHYIWRFPRDERPAMLQRLRAVEQRALVVRLSSDHQAEEFLRRLDRSMMRDGPGG